MKCLHSGILRDYFVSQTNSILTRMFMQTTTSLASICCDAHRIKRICDGNTINLNVVRVSENRGLLREFTQGYEC